jgi:hypothetical protein
MQLTKKGQNRVRMQVRSSLYWWGQERWLGQASEWMLPSFSPSISAGICWWAAASSSRMDIWPESRSSMLLPPPVLHGKNPTSMWITENLNIWFVVARTVVLNFGWVKISGGIFPLLYQKWIGNFNFFLMKFVRIFICRQCFFLKKLKSLLVLVLHPRKTKIFIFLLASTLEKYFIFKTW